MAIDERLFYASHGIDIEKAKQEPCSDCISREATVKRLCKIADYMNERRNGSGSPYIMAALFIQDNKNEFPSVTPKQETVTEFADKCRECGSIIGRNVKQKTGRWLSHREYCENHDLIPSGLVTLEWCSNCDFGIDINELHWGRYKYCPNCGAKMEV